MRRYCFENQMSKNEGSLAPYQEMTTMPRYKYMCPNNHSNAIRPHYKLIISARSLKGRGWDEQKNNDQWLLLLLKTNGKFLGKGIWPKATQSGGFTILRLGPAKNRQKSQQQISKLSTSRNFPVGSAP